MHKRSGSSSRSRGRSRGGITHCRRLPGRDIAVALPYMCIRLFVREYLLCDNLASTTGGLRDPQTPFFSSSSFFSGYARASRRRKLTSFFGWVGNVRLLFLRDDKSWPCKWRFVYRGLIFLFFYFFYSKVSVFKYLLRSLIKLF